MTATEPTDVQAPPNVEAPPIPAKSETRAARARRHGHRARLYAYAVLLIALVVVLIVLASVNTAKVKLSWAFGSTHASLVWIVLAAAIIGWLLGVTTSIVFRIRTRLT